MIKHKFVNSSRAEGQSSNPNKTSKVPICSGMESYSLFTHYVNTFNYYRYWVYYVVNCERGSFYACLVSDQCLKKAVEEFRTMDTKILFCFDSRKYENL